MALKKAMIIVHKGSKTENVQVMFNPGDYKLDTNNSYSWKTVPGLSMPIAQFVSGGTTTLTMDIYFDTYEKGTDVRLLTKKISGLLDVEKEIHAPPLCRFVWGSLDFKGVVVGVNQHFTMFLETGVPVRAKLSVTFKSTLSKKDQLKQIPRHSADRTKLRMLNQGEQLWMLAATEYEDPTLWREIARANQIDNPMKVATGRRISVPRLD
ncbi:peptidoglycan-binding protein [Paenibacillus sp. TAF58]